MLVLDGSEGMLRKTELSIASIGTLSASKTRGRGAQGGSRRSRRGRYYVDACFSLPYFQLPFYVCVQWMQ